MDVLLIAAETEAIDWLTLAISIRGHTSVRADDGETAIQRLEHQPYDLIIIGQMSDDRQRLCRQLRAHPNARTAAIWVTADPRQSADIVRAIDAGATGFLTLPLDPQQLRRRLEMIEHDSAREEEPSNPALVTLQPLLELLPDVAVIVDNIGEIHRTNALTTTLLGYGDQALLGANIEAICHPADIFTLMEQIRASPGMSSIRIRLQRADGDWQPVEVHCRGMRELDADAMRLLLIRDERRCRQPMPQSEPLFDPLTGLAGRNLFTEHLQRSLARGERLNRPLATLLLELPASASEPDTDDEQTLQEVADRIRQSIRAADVAARLSDDQIAILLDDVSLYEHAQIVAHRIQATIATTPVHIGIALSLPGRSRPEDLFSDAETSLYYSSAMQPATMPFVARIQAGTNADVPSDPKDTNETAEPSDMIGRFLALEEHLEQLFSREPQQGEAKAPDNR